VIAEFIRTHAGQRDGDGLRWGVEPICQVLAEHGMQIAPSSYYEYMARRPWPRILRDALLFWRDPPGSS